MGVIFFSGIYGVGKSTLGKLLSRKSKIPYYSASDLITKSIGEQYGPNKVVKNKEKNQQVLIDNVEKILSETNQIIIDGHFCIFNSNGDVEELPRFVFEKIHIERIILLNGDFEKIRQNIRSRDRKDYTQEQLSNLNDKEEKYAKIIVHELRVPFLQYTMKYCDEDINKIFEFIM